MYPSLPAATFSGPRPVELLSPAGDWQCLRAAVANGADAVYFGLSNYSARHRATNFSLDELPQVIEYLHQHNVRGYVACNTLIFSDELPQVARTIAAIARAGADAVIVQDLGVAALARRVAPGLPLHASTQTTLTEPSGIEFVRRLGIERVILARELSLAEIERITQASDLPVEVFVHGALCVAYSGQCLTSEALGGRSANRGQCAQACRLPYELIVDGQKRDLADYAYLLSPQDLAATDQVADLVRLGVRSLKIEGRLKSPQYVAVATSTYRTAIDAAQQSRPFALGRQERLDLAQSFSRGFTPGFLQGVDHQRLVHGRFPKSRGVPVGTVIGRTARGLVVELAGEHRDLEPLDRLLKPGDGLVFDEGHPEQDEQGGRLFEVRRAHGGDAAHCVELVFGNGSIDLAAVSLGSLAWKTDDPAFRRRIERTWSREMVHRRTPLLFCLEGAVGEGLRIIARDADGREAEATWPGPLEPARKHPLTPQLLAEQLGRLGDTPFELAGIDNRLPDGLMVPKSVLNELRRQAVEHLSRLRSAARQRDADPDVLDALRAGISRHCYSASGPPHLYVLVRSLDQLQAVLDWAGRAGDLAPAMVYCDFEDLRRYDDAVAVARRAGMPVGVATLRIIKPGEEGLLSRIARARPDAVLVRNLAAVAFFREHLPQTPRIGDFSLNVANELTADLLSGEGLLRLVPSYDLNWEQLVALAGRIRPDLFEVVVHQHMPMFHMEHCVFAATLSEGKDWRDCGRPCDRHRVQLRDRVGAEFPLLADTGCRNTVFNAVPQSAVEYLPRMLDLGLRHFRVEFLRETGPDAMALLERYARVLAGKEAARSTWHGLNVLNQVGLTRGTLQS